MTRGAQRGRGVIAREERRKGTRKKKGEREMGKGRGEGERAAEEGERENGDWERGK